MADSPTVTKTLKVRVRDKHAKELRRQAAAANFVWNHVNEPSSRSVREWGVFLSAYDIQKYTDGSAREPGLHSHTVQRVGKEYVTRRNQFRKRQLAWRKTFGVRRSLGWVPVNTGAATWKHGQVYFNGQHYRVWDSYGLSQYRFKAASFNEDARGRWYFNVTVEVPSKCDCAGVVFEEVNEAYTTQSCSCCGAIPDSSPKGRTGLGIREWTCSECGASHDRDVNASRNILAVGHDRLAGGIPAL